MVLVAGGVNERSTEFLNLDEGSWFEGPMLPYEIRLGSSIQVEDTLLIVGGYNTGMGLLDTLWKFDLGSEDWMLLDRKLEIPRDQMTAFVVPNSFC